jgi:hypothetical protein
MSWLPQMTWTSTRAHSAALHALFLVDIMWLRQQPHSQNACFQDSFCFNRLIDPLKRNTKPSNVSKDCVFFSWHKC